MNTVKITAIVLALSSCATDVAAQSRHADSVRSGSLRGSVRDDDGERLAGASVLLLHTTIGASTNLDGEYEIEDVPAGTYDVRVSSMGYETIVIPDIVINPGAQERLNVELERQAGGASFTLDDFVVTAERILSTDIAIITERMKAITIGDGISAEQISKSPDGTSSDVLKRVTGLSVVDDKFVFIRGITDRYNSTTLNDVSVSSTDTDTDRKSFTFDIVPASLLANTVVVKTATPDLPGDFSGGLVQVNTLDLPPERVFKLSVSSSYDEETTGSNMLRSQGSDSDWYAIDDGIRSLPGGDLSGNDLARALPNTWDTDYHRAPLNGSYGLAYGDQFDLGLPDGKHTIGLISALTYKNSYETADFVDSPSLGGVETYHFEGTRDKYSVLWSGLANLTYRLNEDHSFSLRTNYVQSAKDQVSFSSGNNEQGGYSTRTTIEWDERTLFVGQLGGEHTLGRRGIGIDWKVFGSTSEASEPDRKNAEFERDSYGNFALKQNYRTWAELYEKSNGGRLDVTCPFGDSSVKAGFYYERRKREYGVDAYYTDTSTIGAPNWGIRIEPIEEIFDEDNYGTKKLTFRTMTTFTGEYEAAHDLDCYYAMVNHPFAFGRQSFRVAGGARVERSRQTVDSQVAVDDPTPLTTVLERTDVLPSVNLTYMPTERTNLRLAYARSVNRPELREMANVLYYDLDNSQNVLGNSDLERAAIGNYDVRFEYFPSAGEVLALSYFHKNIDDAIEERLIPSPDRYVRTWFNSPEGRNYGWELEVRKSMGFMSDLMGGFMSSLFDNITLAGNYTSVESSIEYAYRYTDEQGNAITEIRTRPMQGQAPWTLNVSVGYTNTDWGTSVSFLYNRIARRLDAVGESRYLDVYEESRDLFDIALTQRLFDFVDAKFTAKNITGADVELTSGPEKATHSLVSHSPSYSLSVGMRF